MQRTARGNGNGPKRRGNLRNELAAALLLISCSGPKWQALLDLISGAVEPSALLPMQLPADMKTVELQKEDVPFDMDCYVASEGNAYDFAYGLNWSGRIHQRCPHSAIFQVTGS